MSDRHESTAGEGAVDLVGTVPVAIATTDFDTFYQEHRHRVGAALAFTLGDRHLGFEAVDEAMARAYQRWSVVQAYDNPGGWVYQTGLNWARSWLRRRKRSGPKDRMLAVSDRNVAHQPDTDLAEALTRISDDHRSVVVLRYFCDWSVDETAAALGIAPGTVKSRLARARAALRVELERPVPGDASAAPGQSSDPDHERIER